jgi:hypothetical protein
MVDQVNIHIEKKTSYSKLIAGRLYLKVKGKTKSFWNKTQEISLHTLGLEEDLESTEHNGLIKHNTQINTHN